MHRIARGCGVDARNPAHPLSHQRQAHTEFGKDVRCSG
jgi:hypothetical protein